MRKLPVLQADEAAKLELRARLSLATRPRLNVELGRMDRVSSLLASSSSERARFIEDPTAYLREQSLPVSACHPVMSAAPAQTYKPEQATSPKYTRPSFDFSYFQPVNDKFAFKLGGAYTWRIKPLDGAAW